MTCLLQVRSLASFRKIRSIAAGAAFAVSPPLTALHSHNMRTCLLWWMAVVVSCLIRVPAC
jgi:hypothetical protein